MRDTGMKLWHCPPIYMFILASVCHTSEDVMHLQRTLNLCIMMYPGHLHNGYLLSFWSLSEIIFSIYKQLTWEWFEDMATIIPWWCLRPETWTCFQNKRGISVTRESDGIVFTVILILFYCHIPLILSWSFLMCDLLCLISKLNV